MKWFLMVMFFQFRLLNTSFSYEHINAIRILLAGTIVSIKDIDQHMYVAVDRAESGYNLVGAIHYSLVGERALFRVCSAFIHYVCLHIEVTRAL